MVKGCRRVADGNHGAGKGVAPKRDGGSRPSSSPFSGQFGRALIADQAPHLIVRRQPAPGNPVGDHLCIGDDRCTAAQGSPRCWHQVIVKDDMPSQTHIAGGVNHAYRDHFLLGGEPR